MSLPTFTTFTAYTKIQSSKVNANFASILSVLTGNLDNANISASAAIARSKLASGTNYRILANSSSGVMSENAALTSAHVLYADANGQIAGEAQLSASRGGLGISTAASTGVPTVSAGTWSVAAQLTALRGGTGIDTSASTGIASVASGTWSVISKIPETQGGTNQSTFTTGDILYASGANTLSKLGIGSAGQILKVAGGVPAWGAGSGLLTVVSKTGNYIITSSDNIVLCDASGGSFTLTLPTAAGITGTVYQIIRTDSTLANGVTIDGNGSETIQGALTRKLMTKYESVVIVSDGTNWQVLDHRCDTEWDASSWTPTGTWSTNTTYTGRWRRIGDHIEAQVKVATSGAPTSATLNVNLPSGLTADTAKIISTSTQQASLGQCVVDDSASVWYPGIVVYQSTTAVRPMAADASTTFLKNATISETSPITFGSGDSVTMRFAIPITDWWV